MVRFHESGNAKFGEKTKRCVHLTDVQPEDALDIKFHHHSIHHWVLSSEGLQKDLCLCLLFVLCIYTPSHLVWKTVLGTMPTGQVLSVRWEDIPSPHPFFPLFCDFLWTEIILYSWKAPSFGVKKYLSKMWFLGSLCNFEQLSFSKKKKNLFISPPKSLFTFFFFLHFWMFHAILCTFQILVKFCFWPLK